MKKETWANLGWKKAGGEGVHVPPAPAVSMEKGSGRGCVRVCVPPTQEVWSEEGDGVAARV